MGRSLFLRVVGVERDVFVVVPRLVVAVVELHDAHAAFDQPAGQEAGVGEFAVAVAAARDFGFATQVERFLRGTLHAEGHFERGDAGVELVVGAALGQVRAVHALQQIELPALLAARKVFVADVGNDRVRVDRRVVDVRALVNARQEAVAPQLRADDRLAGAEHDEAGQVLILGAEGVGQPGAHAGADRLHVAAVHEQAGRAHGSRCRCASSG